MDQELLEYLESFLTESRKEIFQKVLNNRTRHLSVVLEDIYQAQNASAVLRSCDCFGIQDVHIIENKNTFQVHRDIAMGSSKWLSMSHYSEKENNTREALRKLKNEGYRIVATSPHTDDTLLEDFDVEKGKFALVFGTELTGISDIVKEEADEFMRIPMYGFTESFNISVSAALSMHHLIYKLRDSDVDWKLSSTEKREVYSDWIKKTIKATDQIIDRYYKDKL